MSAVTPPETVDQLARALAPHTVLVHHDFSQTPDFPLTSGNVRFVPHPVRTGWATFGFVEGIFHALAHALERLEFDYLQLLSPTCLPIKPMAQFEAHVTGPAEAHFSCIDLLADPDCLMWVGYRAFTPDGSFRHRVLRRLSTDYFRGLTGRRDEAGVWLRSGRGHGLQALAARAVVRAFSQPWIGRHPFGEGFRPYYGSVWFGARRHVVRKLVDGFRQPGVRDYFSRLRIAEEFLVPTLLMRHTRTRGPLNHYINRFIEAHPSKIDVDEIGLLRAMPAFFARKFPNEPEHPARLRVLHELVQGAPATPPTVSTATAGEPAVRPAPELASGVVFTASMGLPPLSATQGRTRP
ncbi:hypothetical protein [Ramlibacter tataouinensis]|nr:hypothetical protein [Ramlibacter tataouinensis]